MNSWDELIKIEAQKPYFKALQERIVEEYKRKTIYPPQGEIFNAFKLCPLNDTLVVFIGQDPYHEFGEAHGLAFSVKNGCKMPPSLKNVFKELSDDLKIKEPTNTDLTIIAKQGVLFLNRILTVKEHLAMSHKNYGWEIFTDEVIKTLNDLNRPIVFILLGKEAIALTCLITNPIHLIITAPHPSPLSSYRGFFGSKVFSRCNDFLNEHYQKTIDWNQLNK